MENDLIIANRSARPGQQEWDVTHSVAPTQSLRGIVIGYGCTLRGDDGVGWHVASLLFDVVRCPRIEVRAEPQLAPELAIELAMVQWALFIDADAHLSPLTWLVQPLARLVSRTYSLASHLEPAVLLSLTRELYGSCPRCYLFRIGADYFDFDDRLSPAMAQRLPQLVEAARSHVAGWHSTTQTESVELSGHETARDGTSPAARFEGVWSCQP